MGEENARKVQLYLKTADGEYTPIPAEAAEITLSSTDAESEGLSFMSCGNACRFCAHADTKRRKDDKIRCKHFSQWVDPRELCEEYAFMAGTFDRKEIFTREQFTR